MLPKCFVAPVVCVLLSLAALSATLPINDAMIVVDMSEAEPSSSLQFALSTAAGLENREEARVYVVRDKFDADWLQYLVKDSYQTVAVEQFLGLMYSKYGAILYSSQQKDALPAVVTLAGVKNALPMDESLAKQFPDTTVVFDTRGRWHGETTAKLAMESVADVSDLVLNATTSIAIQGPDDVLKGHLVDWIVARKLFTHFLPNCCIPLTPEKALLKRIVDNSPWQRPVRVYGYNLQSMLFKGYVYEAETNCINSMGQIATENAANLAFWRNYDPIVTGGDSTQRTSTVRSPLKQSPSPYIEYNEDKTYVALVYGDMDNIDFVQSFGSEHMKTRAKRCSQPDTVGRCFPLTWTISPNMLDFSPAMMKWYYEQAASTGGRDWFIMPPSGTLYAYPSEMTLEVQKEYAEQQNRQAELMDTTGTIHWEWIFTWRHAYHDFFPQFANTTGTRHFFLNNVPWMFPIAMLPKQTYRFFGEGPLSADASVVVFKPAFNWMEGNKSGGLDEDAKAIAAKINKMDRGSVHYVYIIQNTDMESVFDMADALDEHVELVGYRQLVDLAVQREAARARE